MKKATDKTYLIQINPVIKPSRCQPKVVILMSWSLDKMYHRLGHMRRRLRDDQQENNVKHV